MKLTKSKLKQIIKEEISRLLKEDKFEGLESFPPEVQKSMKTQNRYLQQVRDSGQDPWDHLDEVLAHLQEKHPELADEIANWYYLYME
jgi:phosphomevalonate kinase